MITQLKQSLREFRIGFDRKIAQYFDIKINEQRNLELKEVFGHLENYVLAGGKRLRPYILHRMNEDFRKLDSIDDIFLGFELLHNSTLIDDDIIDKHDIRRNKPTLVTTYTNRIYRSEFAALLSANLLRDEGLDIILASGLSTKFQRECLLAYQDICISIDEAQMLSLIYRKKLDTSEKDYFEYTDLVAARFFANMFQLCANEEYKKEFFEVGRNIGIAYQLRDDLMDIDTIKMKGRPTGSDIKEGQVTILSIHAYQNLMEKNKERFASLFGDNNIQECDLNWVIEQYKETGAIEYVKKQIGYYVNRTFDLLQEIGIKSNHWIYHF